MKNSWNVNVLSQRFRVPLHFWARRILEPIRIRSTTKRYDTPHSIMYGSSPRSMEASEQMNNKNSSRTTTGTKKYISILLIPNIRYGCHSTIKWLRNHSVSSLMLIQVDTSYFVLQRHVFFVLAYRSCHHVIQSMYSGRSIIRANDQMTTKPFPPLESARQKREELEIRQRPVVSNMSQQSYRYSLSIFCVSHIPDTGILL